jgi:hypothetical protein
MLRYFVNSRSPLPSSKRRVTSKLGNTSFNILLTTLFSNNPIIRRHAL